MCILFNRDNYKYFSILSSLSQHKEVSYSVNDSKNISNTFLKEYTVMDRSNYDCDFKSSEIWVEQQWYCPNLLGFITKCESPDAYNFCIKLKREYLSSDLLFYLDYIKKYDSYGIIQIVNSNKDGLLRIQEIYTDNVPDTCNLYLVHIRDRKNEYTNLPIYDTLLTLKLINKELLQKE